MFCILPSSVIFCFISWRLCSDKTPHSNVSVLNISLFSEKTQGCWILTHLYSHTPKNNQMTIESFQGAFTGPRPFSRAFNHIQPKPIPTVFWAKSIHRLSSRFSLLLTVVGSHTHTGGICWNDSCVWSLCTYPPVSVVLAWAWGPGEGTPQWSPGCVMVLGGNVLCLMSGVDQVAAHPQGMCCLWIELLDYRWGHMSRGAGSDRGSFCLLVINKGRITVENTDHFNSFFSKNVYYGANILCVSYNLNFS